METNITSFPIHPISEYLNWAVTSYHQTVEDVQMGFGDQSDVDSFKNEISWATNEMFKLFNMNTPTLTNQSQYSEN